MTFVHVGSVVAARCYVIPSEVEEPYNCGKAYAGRRDPSTSLRMTGFVLERNAPNDTCQDKRPSEFAVS
jgi:hypothetical protein